MSRCANPECRDPLLPRQGGPGRPRKWCSAQCRRRVCHQEPGYKLAAARRQDRLRKAVKGRDCQWCLRMDSEVAWSSNQFECQACHRQRARRRCGRCGGPSYVVGLKSRRYAPDPGCVAHQARGLVLGDCCSRYVRRRVG